MNCYVLFAEPGSVFQGLHRTIDGAVHRAAALGAIATETGGEMFVDDITKTMAAASAISFYCAEGDEFTHVRIERHGLYM